MATQHGASNVRVFGSVAREGEQLANDVDFLVQMQRGRALLDLVGLWQDLEELLDCKVDVVTEEGVSPYLRERIFKEAVSL